MNPLFALALTCATSTCSETPDRNLAGHPELPAVSLAVPGPAWGIRLDTSLLIQDDFVVMWTTDLPVERTLTGQAFRVIPGTHGHDGTSTERESRSPAKKRILISLPGTPSAREPRCACEQGGE